MKISDFYCNKKFRHNIIAYAAFKTHLVEKTSFTF